MKKRYRQTMTLTFDVWADNWEEATGLIADVYFDCAHEWWPSETMIVADSEPFFPINEME